MRRGMVMKFAVEVCMVHTLPPYLLTRLRVCLFKRAQGKVGKFAAGAGSGRMSILLHSPWRCPWYIPSHHIF